MDGHGKDGSQSTGTVCAGETNDWVTRGGEEGPRETRGGRREEGIQEGVRVGD